MEKNSEKETITLNIGPIKSFFTKIPKHNWALATYVFAIITVVLIIVILSGNSLTGKVISENNIEGKIENFVNNQLIEGGQITIESIEKSSGIYIVTVSLEGQSLPLYFTTDGKFISQGQPLQDISDFQELNENYEYEEVSVDDDPIKGDINAPVTIIEFSDFQCPFCAKFYIETLPQIQKNYIDTGKVKLIYRDFPLSSIHPQAQEAAEAAQCVYAQGGDEAYYEMHDLLFETQDLSNNNLKLLARSLGYDISDCLDSNEMEAEVLADLADGSAAGVSGTPAFFINGIKIEGAQPYANFEAAIEAALLEQ